MKLIFLWTNFWTNLLCCFSFCFLFVSGCLFYFLPFVLPFSAGYAPGISAAGFWSSVLWSAFIIDDCLSSFFAVSTVSNFQIQYLNITIFNVQLIIDVVCSWWMDFIGRRQISPVICYTRNSQILPENRDDKKVSNIW